MIWSGSISLEAGRAAGHLADDWQWVLGIDGTPLGPNRLTLRFHVERRGIIAPLHSHPASHRQHTILSGDGPARMEGDLLRREVALGRSWTWTGAFRGPWLMRLETLRVWLGEGPVALRAVPVQP